MRTGSSIDNKSNDIESKKSREAREARAAIIYEQQNLRSQITSNLISRSKKSKNQNNTHECIVCKKVFYDASKLLRHLRSHTNEKPWECSVCHKRFVDRSSMLRHEKT